MIIALIYSGEVEVISFYLSESMPQIQDDIVETLTMPGQNPKT